MSNANNDWPFFDPPNTAVFTTVSILDGTDWVHHVTHDEEDGAWQFLSSRGPAAVEEAAVIGLKHMLVLEPRVTELADLPLGWRAWREAPNAPWQRAPK